MNGGKPVFADINPDTLCIEPETIAKLITKKTRAVIPVHFGGMPCNIEKILDTSNKCGIKVIEDAAHAAGASYNKNKIGGHGFAVCFSFHPVKNLAMPTGGLIAINDKNHKKIRNLIQAKRWCGIENRKDDSYEINELGDNYYMNEFSAIIGIEQLKKLNKMNSIRKKIAKQYFSGMEIERKMPFEKECSYHLYWICVKNREDFRKKLYENGIQTGTHYKPIHTFSLYHDHTKLPYTEIIGKQIVTIPMHPNITEDQVDKIISLTNKFAK
jgi:dTDP-4-amino-4,6-dideoxygalactose transaminase